MSSAYSPLPAGDDSSSLKTPGQTNTLEPLESFEDDDGGHDGTGEGRPSGHMRRLSTATSLGGFGYRDGLLPLTPSTAETRDHADEKHVGVMRAMALVVGMQVGSGIFSSPGVVVAEVGSPGASLIVWVASGLLAWTGASSYAELGCAIPLSGGAQAYLAYAFGPLASYLYTWTAVSTLKPGSSAIIALIFGEYVNRMIYHAVSSDISGNPAEWTFKVTAVLAIIIATVLNLVSRTMGTASSVVITGIKIVSLVFVFVLGLIFLIRNGPALALSPAEIFQDTSTSPGSYAIALYSGLWAFDGWDQCNFVAGEMHHPQRDLPRALHSSMSIVLTLFLFANLSYFNVLSPEVVASSNTVALDFGRVTIGRFGVIVFSTLVAISCFGALSNGFYTTAGLIYASAKDRFLPEIFTRLHHRRRTPDHAMLLHATLTVLYVVFGGGFRTLLNFFSIPTWTFYLAAVLGLLVLRVKEPHLNRPYKTWIITPVVFCFVAMFLLLMPIFAAPWEALAAVAFMVAGVPMYYLNTQARLPSDQRRGMSNGSKVARLLQGAWQHFIEDVQSWKSGASQRHKPPNTTAREENLSMLRSEHLEMSER